MARQSLAAARRCGFELPRSCASRAYFAAFAATHWRLVSAGTRPRAVFGTWTHKELPLIARANLVSELRSPDLAGQVAQTLARLRWVREIADYRPGFEIDRADAMRALADASLVVRILGA